MGSRVKTRPRSSSQRAPDRMPDLLLPSSDQRMRDTARQMQEIHDRRAAIAEESRRLDEKASRDCHGTVFFFGINNNLSSVCCKIH